eukprot:gb/GECG01000227.1/.p1 GENE.gb/GECG01000227.1/~~gb/GECG01000227.1/.p1  ORF type:complete len:145 (+),score=16.13 gb/GECG01000227.1/:1-435(+)
MSKPLNLWYASQRRYTAAELAKHLSENPASTRDIAIKRKAVWDYLTFVRDSRCHGTPDDSIWSPQTPDRMRPPQTPTNHFMSHPVYRDAVINSTRRMNAVATNLLVRFTLAHIAESPPGITRDSSESTEETEEHDEAEESKSME